MQFDRIKFILIFVKCTLIMNNLQKIILVSLITISGVSWFLSINQPEMMNIMKSYNPLLIVLFVVSWTFGMAAMMFPAIVPMVLLYSKLLTNKQSDSDSSTETLQPRLSTFKVGLFVGMYLAIWSITGLALLLAWSIPMNSIVMFQDAKSLGIIFGSILIVSGIYQFTSLKNTCIGYCESPLSFFMRRWNNGITGAIKMGVCHGLYCLGCCWPYFLIMLSLGWMNITWMGIFAAIIFGEKIWPRGIWIAGCVGIVLITLGILSSMGLIILYDGMVPMNTQSEDNVVM
jgi:predicted metal-binding membrane protein